MQRRKFEIIFGVFGLLFVSLGVLPSLFQLCFQNNFAREKPYLSSDIRSLASISVEVGLDFGRFFLALLLFLVFWLVSSSSFENAPFSLIVGCFLGACLWFLV